SHINYLLYCHATPRHPHSFPTRRSSDLARQQRFELAAGDLALELLERRFRLGDHPGVLLGFAEPDHGDLVVELLGDASDGGELADRKSTRLNSSHVKISYAVFCLKKKNK